MRAGNPSRARWRRRGRPRYAGALTPRQQDVFELLVTGLTNEEIAQQLGITAYGVKYHVAEILLRLDVENRYEAASLHLRTEGNGRLAAWAPVMFLRKLPFASPRRVFDWLPHAAAGAVLTATAAGIALLAWGVMSTSTATVTTPGCTSVEQSAGNAPPCAPGVAQAAVGAGAISAISAGGSQTCALKDGGVWCWGFETGGRSGDGIECLSQPPDQPLLCVATAPVALGGPTILSLAWAWLASGVSAISAGYNYNNCALKDGGVRCWPGQVGNNSSADSPVAVSGLASGVSAISAGWDLICALKDGGAWCWGGNWAGQVGNNSTTDSPVPVAVLGLTSGVRGISAGDAHVCALKDGGVWCWGSNGDGELGNDSTTRSLVPVTVSGLASGVSAISAGPAHNCALKDSGIVWCWGANGNGQLGNDSTTDSSVPVVVSGLGSGVSAISAGGGDSCALKGGGVWCWGANGNGQLGNNSRTDSPVPVVASGLASGVSSMSTGRDHSCALKDDGVLCWGLNSFGQLGNNSPVDVGQLGNNSPADSLVPVPVQFPPPSAGDIAEAADAQPLASQTSTDSADHHAAYVLGGTAAAALAIVVAGVWAVRRRRRSRTDVDDLDVWRKPGA